MHCLHESTGICGSCDELLNEQAPALKQEEVWYHKDGTVCPDMSDCDTWEHSSVRTGDLFTGDNERTDVAAEVIDGRESVYGEVVDGMIRIAQMWSAYLGKDGLVEAHDVPAMMILMKLVRYRQSPDYSDHTDDVEGYLDIIRQIIGEDMIHARDVKDFIRQKYGDGEVFRVKGSAS